MASIVEPGQLDPTVVRHDEGDADLAIDRRRQDEPGVDVGVLADQVDPTGGAHDPHGLGICRGRRLTRRKRRDQLIGLERRDHDTPADRRGRGARGELTYARRRWARWHSSL